MHNIRQGGTLGDFAGLQRGTTYKSRLLGTDGPWLLGLACIARNGGFKADNLKTYGGPSDAKILVGPGDILVSLKDVTQAADLLGSVVTVPASIGQGRLTQDTVKLVFDDDFSERNYIYWLLRTPQARDHCRRHATGTTNLGLAREDFLALEVPPLDEGRENLLQVLQALDDKIELNRQMNETLEAQARTLFRDWFVDFGPVKAKMAGDTPYLAPDLWSLFPNGLKDGVPEGWASSSLDQIIEFNPREKLTKGEDAPYLAMANLPTRGSRTDNPVRRAFASGSKFRNGDALLARITPCLENGKTAFVDCLSAGIVGWGSTEFIVMRSKPPVPRQVAYLIARDPEFRAAAIQSMSGTSGRQRASVDALTAYPAVIPHDEQVWAVLGSFLDPIFDKIAANAEECHSLSQARDLLLPKLMSGEIRVRESA